MLTKLRRWGARVYRAANAVRVRWWPGFGRLAACLSLVALLSLIFLAGQATMYFGLPPSTFATKAFTGAQDWFETVEPNDGRRAEGMPPQAAVVVDRLAATCDGYTLITLNTSPEALLLDMKGAPVHQWKMPTRRCWPRAAHVSEPLPEDPVHWEQCYLYPNGDLLALCAGGSPYGYGLAKFDKDSNLLWGYSGNVHHDFDVGDDGRIYVLTTSVSSAPTTGPTPQPERYTPEALVTLSPRGRELDVFPLYEAFRASPYFLAFLSGADHNKAASALAAEASQQPASAPPSAQEVFTDIIHSNSVQVLSKALAPKFPQFREGMVLISLRSSSVLAVVDPGTHSVVWAAQGPWHGQHSAQFLDNGHLLLFDNLGSSRSSRILEYDPVTQAIPWCYPGEQNTSFQVSFRGRTQRLANGNTLIFTAGQRVFEVTKKKDLVWELGIDSNKPISKDERWKDHTFTGARRYLPEELTFLKPEQTPRP